VAGRSEQGEDVKAKVKEVNSARPVVFQQDFGFCSKESGSHGGI